MVSPENRLQHARAATSWVYVAGTIVKSFPEVEGKKSTFLDIVIEDLTKERISNKNNKSHKYLFKYENEISDYVLQ